MEEQKKQIEEIVKEDYVESKRSMKPLAYLAAAGFAALTAIGVYDAVNAPKFTEPTAQTAEVKKERNYVTWKEVKDLYQESQASESDRAVETFVYKTIEKMMPSEDAKISYTHDSREFMGKTSDIIKVMGKDYLEQHRIMHNPEINTIGVLKEWIKESNAKRVGTDYQKENTI